MEDRIKMLEQQVAQLSQALGEADRIAGEKERNLQSVIQVARQLDGEKQMLQGRLAVYEQKATETKDKRKGSKLKLCPTPDSEA